MHSSRKHPENLPWNRKLESSQLRGSLRELQTKFVQLEEAFKINLEWQRQREMKFNRMQLENQEFRAIDEDRIRAMTELSSRLTEAVGERDHWKNAFHRQKEITERSKADCECAVNSIKDECHSILKTTRETTEKHLGELFELYNDSERKMLRLEEEARARELRRTDCENRSLELANLLETVKDFEVNADSICRFVADALKNLTEDRSSFETSLKNLRRLTWVREDKRENDELVRLRKQNSVLREIVKDLKRRASTQTLDGVPAKDNEQLKNIIVHGGEAGSQVSGNKANGNLSNKTHTLHPHVPAVPLTKENNKNHAGNTCQESKTEERKEPTAHDTYVRLKNDDNTDAVSASNKNAKVFCIESHSNGIFYEEYVLQLAIDREIKIKYPSMVAGDGAATWMELVDDQEEYERSPLDGIRMLLNNIRACVRIKQAGMSCGTQTLRPKSSSCSTQTVMTGMHSFSRLNVGATMLNSEKRAIERSLWNLERTVLALKSNTLGQARSVVGKDSKFLANDEFFECVRLLTR